MSPTFQLGVGAVSTASDDSSRCRGLERCCRPCVDGWLVVDLTAVEKEEIHVDLPLGWQLCDLSSAAYRSTLSLPRVSCGLVSLQLFHFYTICAAI